MSYNDTRLTVSFTLLPPIPELSKFFRSMQVVCTALRPPRPRPGGCLSVAQWHLERYEPPPAVGDATSSASTLSEYSIRPAMALGNKPLPDWLEQHGCWKELFDMGFGTVVSLDQPLSADSQISDADGTTVGKGLELSFEMMVSMAAVELSLVVEGGIILMGYSTILIPVAVVGKVAQWHLISRSSKEKGQINPHATNLGPRMETTDLAQFHGKRCFLGWCRSAQINLGTEGLPAEVDYTNSREVERSLIRDGFSVLTQLGASAPLNAVLGFQTNLRYTSHRVRFTQMNNYRKLLRDTAREVAMVYDSGTRQCWLVPKLSLLLHMMQAYAIWTGKQAPFVSPHADATAVVETLDSLGEVPILEDKGSELLFRQLLFSLNTNLLDTASSKKKSSGSKLYGFEFMDVVIAPGSGSCVKQHDLGAHGRNWLELANIVDAVVVCSGLGEAISPVSDPKAPTRPNAVCNALPKGLDYLAATIPCLKMLAYRRGVSCLSDPAAGHVRISQGIFWDVSGDPFTSCSHGEEAEGCCWREGRTQQILTLRSFTIEFWKGQATESVSVDMPVAGAVAFGSRRVLKSRGRKGRPIVASARQDGGVGRGWSIGGVLFTLLALEKEA